MVRHDKYIGVELGYSTHGRIILMTYYGQHEAKGHVCARCGKFGFS